MEVIGGSITATVLQSYVPHDISHGYVVNKDVYTIWGSDIRTYMCVCVSMYCIYVCRLHVCYFYVRTCTVLWFWGAWVLLIVETGYARLYIQVSTYVYGIYMMHTIYVRACVTYSYWWAICTARYSTWNSSQQAMLRPCHHQHHHPVERDTDRQTHWQTDTNTHIQCMCTHLLLNGVIICSLYKIRTKAESSLTHTRTHVCTHTHTLQLSSCNQSWPPS